MHPTKSSQKAQEFREIGNKYYAAKKFYNAVLNYNKAICYAEEGSLEIGLSYGNRSAVYFEIGEYDLCLANIKLALVQAYPQEHIEKIRDREQKCKSKMNNPETKVNFCVLSREPNRMLPFIVECLKIKEDERFGRCVVATKDIKAGEILAIESPFFTLFSEQPRACYYDRCYNCVSSNMLNLFPCDHCPKGKFNLNRGLRAVH
jgi:SET and MYND domain-containing protein 4